MQDTGTSIRRLIEGDAWADSLGDPWRRAEPLVRVTPLLDAPALAEEGGARHALVKAEGLQRTGSFKIRGAALRLATLFRGEAGRGVVAASAGNHGLGVAEAARAFGLDATVVVPETAPGVKRAGIAAAGARIVVEGSGYDEAEGRARELASETGAVFVSGFDDEHVIAGNGGTIGRELAAQGLGPDDVVVVPVGGGGLASGLGAALASSGAMLVGVEPETNHAMYDSFRRGAAVTHYPEGGPTLAEGLEGAVSAHTFALCREALADVVLVSEAALRHAIGWSYRSLGLVLEPSAAAAVAAVLERAVDGTGRRVVCVTTGSNVEPDLLDSVLRAG